MTSMDATDVSPPVSESSSQRQFSIIGEFLLFLGRGLSPSCLGGHSYDVDGVGGGGSLVFHNGLPKLPMGLDQGRLPCKGHARFLTLYVAESANSTRGIVS